MTRLEQPAATPVRPHKGEAGRHRVAGRWYRAVADQSHTGGGMVARDDAAGVRAGRMRRGQYGCGTTLARARGTGTRRYRFSTAVHPFVHRPAQRGGDSGGGHASLGGVRLVNRPAFAATCDHERSAAPTQPPAPSPTDRLDTATTDL
jgi:hypothetical protein